MIAGNSELEFTLGHDGGVLFLTLVSRDGMNRLTRRKVAALKDEIEGLSSPGPPVVPLVISGDPIFSAGADLNEISQLNGTYVEGVFRPGDGIQVGWAIALRGGGPYSLDRLLGKEL